jgi:hypothetical protein
MNVDRFLTVVTAMCFVAIGLAILWQYTHASHSRCDDDESLCVLGRPDPDFVEDCFATMELAKPYDNSSGDIHVPCPPFNTTLQEELH